MAVLSKPLLRAPPSLNHFASSPTNATRRRVSVHRERLSTAQANAFLFDSTANLSESSIGPQNNSDNTDSSDDEDNKDDRNNAFDVRPFVVSGTTALQAYANMKMGAPVSLACIPVIIPFSMPYEQVMDMSHMYSENATKLQKTLMQLTATQGGLALFQMMVGDLLGGFLGGVMASVGMYSTMPHGIVLFLIIATRWLPTYTVISFINGSVATLQFLEKLTFSSFAFVSIKNPMIINAIHLAGAAGPVVSFLGVYYAYQYLKELRTMANTGGIAQSIMNPETRNTVLEANANSRNTYTPFQGSSYSLNQRTPMGADQDGSRGDPVAIN